MEWIEELAGDHGTRFLDVLETLDRAAADHEHDDKVSVMSLMCGSGKSSAISLKIAQIIHAINEEGSTDGLLVVSDTKEALKRYLDPKLMPDVKQYLDSNSSQISRMDADTFEVEKARYWKCPVLLITYSRYFGYTKDQIRHLFLTWGRERHPRTLIIMDEQPPILEYISVGNRDIAAFDAGIRSGLNISDPAMYRWCIEKWEPVRDRLYKIIEERSISELKEENRAYFIVQSGDSVLPQDDLQKLVKTVEDNQESIQAEDSNILKTFNAMLSILRDGAFGYGWKKPEGDKNVVLLVVENNVDLVTNLGTKVIVMDGTADISPIYELSCFYHFPCDEMNTRKLENLTIKLVHMNTSKWAFNNRKEEIVKGVREYLMLEMESLRDVGLITYIKKPEQAFIRDRQYGLVEHLGNTRGRNDMLEYRKMAQVGLHRSPPLVYTLEAMELNHDLYGKDSIKEFILEIADNPFGSIFLQSLSEDAKFSDDLMNREILTDLEQNVFRTSLRDPDYAGEVVFYLFADLNGWSRLLNLIYKRFAEKYGAKVEREDYATISVKEIRKRETNAHRLIDWLAQRYDGEVFQKQKMLEEANLTENQFASIKKDRPIVAVWFREMSEALDPPQKGVYKMTEEILRLLK